MKRKLAVFLIAAMLLSFAPLAHARDELKNTDPDKYYILLDTSNQTVTVFEKDDEGEYTRIVRRMLCTSGRTEIDPTIPDDKGTPTPNGVWKVGARERFGKFAAFAGEYARYWTQVVDGIYFHSIMFSKRDITKLKSSPYRNLGSKGSHGCIRLYVEDAKWLYYNACPGTTVEVTGKGGGGAEVNRALRSKMSFDEYDAFQQNIYDGEPLPDRTAWVVAEEATLRTGNGSNDSIIMRLEAGQQITILQEGDPWVKALVGEKEGYVKRAYVTYTEGVLESDPEGKIVRSTVYLYEKPDDDSRRICKVPHDTSLIILEEGEDYTKVQYWTEVGYIKTGSIKTDWAMIYDEDDPYHTPKTQTEG